MDNRYSITISEIIKALELEMIYMPAGAEKTCIYSSDVSRTSLELSGVFDNFVDGRILLIGKTEHNYLSRLSKKDRSCAIDRLFSRKPPAVVLSRSLEVFDEIRKSAKENDVTLLCSGEKTSNLIASLVMIIEHELAPRITRHGVLVELYGEGLLIIGDSGVGKSETAIELIKRGHCLIADDAVEIRRVSDKTLIGSSPNNIRHFIELRGIGIINARRIFGMSAVKPSGTIDLVVNLENWDKTKIYDRMGLDEKYTDILGVKVPMVTVPVNPGRNLSVIMEVAAMNNRHKKMGYNAAKELLEHLGMDYESHEIIEDDSKMKF